MQFEKQQIKIDSNFTSEIFGIDRSRADELLDLTIPLLKKYSSSRNWRSRMEFYSFQKMLNDFTLLAKNRDEESFLIFQAGIKIEEWRHIGSDKGCQCPECRAENAEDKEEDDEFLDLLKSIFGRNQVAREDKPKVGREEIMEKLMNAINKEFGGRGVTASTVDFDPFSSNMKGRSLKLQATDESIRPEVDRFAKKVLDENGWRGIMI